MAFQQLVNGWNQFFYTSESFATVGAFRVVWGALLLVSGLLMAKDARRYYGPEGVFSASRYQRLYGKSRFSLFQLLPESLASVYLVLIVHLASCVLVMIGLFTRTSTIVCWATLVSLHHRNPCVVHSGDTILRLLTFLLIFSHAGDAFAVDQIWTSLERHVESRERAGGNPVAVIDVGNQKSGSPWAGSPWAGSPCAGSPWAGSPWAGSPWAGSPWAGSPWAGSPWAVRLMQIQISIVYLRTVFWKLRGKRWWNGTAAYYPTQVTSFSRLSLPSMFINRFWIGLATYGTLLGEASLGTLVWIDEFRYPVLLAGILLHLILELFLNLQLFGWTMIASFLLFVPPSDMQAWIGLVTRW